MDFFIKEDVLIFFDALFMKADGKAGIGFIMRFKGVVAGAYQGSKVFSSKEGKMWAFLLALSKDTEKEVSKSLLFVRCEGGSSSY